MTTPRAAARRQQRPHHNATARDPRRLAVQTRGRGRRYAVGPATRVEQLGGRDVTELRLRRSRGVVAAG